MKPPLLAPGTSKRPQPPCRRHSCRRAYGPCSHERYSFARRCSKRLASPARLRLVSDTLAARPSWRRPEASDRPRQTQRIPIRRGSRGPDGIFEWRCSGGRRSSLDPARLSRLSQRTRAAITKMKPPTNSRARTEAAANRLEVSTMRCSPSTAAIASLLLGDALSLIPVPPGPSFLVQPRATARPIQLPLLARSCLERGSINRQPGARSRRVYSAPTPPRPSLQRADAPCPS